MELDGGWSILSLTLTLCIVCTVWHVTSLKMRFNHPDSPYVHDKSKPHKPRGILLVLAHPDDESMFFIPSLLHWSRYEIPVHLICLSNGNVDGLGLVREQELTRCWVHVLGQCRTRLTIVNHQDLPDGMHT